VSEAGPLRLAWRREVIEARVRSLGEEIAERYSGRELVLVGVLKGAAVFLADLVRATPLPLQLDFLALRPLDPRSRLPGPPALSKDLELDIAGRPVLLVEDIVDTGVTLAQVLRLLAARDPASLRVCTLLDRPSNRVARIPVDHVGFTVGSAPLVGYGIDLAGGFRNCPDLWEVRDLQAVLAQPRAALTQTRRDPS
jgi:hypoxanthine phosphoribosyltransferase